MKIGDKYTYIGSLQSLKGTEVTINSETKYGGVTVRDQTGRLRTVAEVNLARVVSLPQKAIDVLLDGVSKEPIRREIELIEALDKLKQDLNTARKLAVKSLINSGAISKATYPKPTVVIETETHKVIRYCADLTVERK